MLVLKDIRLCSLTFISFFFIILGLNETWHNRSPLIQFSGHCSIQKLCWNYTLNIQLVVAEQHCHNKNNYCRPPLLSSLGTGTLRVQAATALHPYTGVGTGLGPPSPLFQKCG